MKLSWNEDARAGARSSIAANQAFNEGQWG
jgi:hypothetical protein